MAAIVFSCTKCRASLAVPFDAMGRPVDCPDCGTVNVTPAPTATTRAAPKEQESTANDRDLDSGPDPLEYRRNQLAAKRRHKRMVFSIALIGAVLSVAISGAYLLVKNKRERRSDEVAKGEVATQKKPEPKKEDAPTIDARPRVPVLPNQDDVDLRPSPPDQEMLGPTRQPEEVKPPRPPFVKSPKVETSPGSGYYGVSADGFSISVSRLAYEKSDDADGEPLQVVYDELARISELLPPDTLKALRGFSLWVEWDHTIPQSAHAFAVYYGTIGEGLLSRGVDPKKADCVCVLSLKTAWTIKKSGGRQLTLLHEFSHIVHSKVYPNNPFIKNAFDQARARSLYGRLAHDNGSVGPGYASRNDHEYFAELTCAYFDRLDYPPHNREELKEFDSVGYEMMTKAWGTPEVIEKLKKDALAKKTTPKKK